LRFQKEIDNLVAADSSVKEDHLFIFAGSSSFRLWKDMTTDLSAYNVINRGFGGSEMSDLVYYADQLILKHDPEKIFIYEGDNDLGAKRPLDTIMRNADRLVKKIRQQLPDAKIYFLTPKPCPSRWHLKQSYVQFNKKLKRFAKHHKNVKMIDVWKPLLGKNKEPRKELFIEDQLHMNRQGYAMWVEILKPYLKE
jgi:lysophospholipase L1-like esterase